MAEESLSLRRRRREEGGGEVEGRGVVQERKERGVYEMRARCSHNGSAEI